MSPSLASAVAPYRLPYSTLRRQYACFLNLASRLLGLVPSFSSYAQISPLSLNFYFAALATCFRIPACDFGIRTISPRLRRLATLQSSITHKCHYCIAHTCLMGSLISGSQIEQLAKAGGWHSFIGTISDDDELLLQLVKEACSFPAAIRAETRDRFYRVFGKEAYQDVASIVSFMGWLNYMMLSFGMEIESEAAPFAALILNTHDPSIQLDQQIADDGHHQKGQETVQWITNKDRASLFRRIFEHLRSAFRLFSLIPSVIMSIIKEAELMGGIPKKIDALDLYMWNHFGHNPAFVRNVTDGMLKRILVFGSREVLLNDAFTSWTRTERLLLFYAFARFICNPTIEEDVVQLLHVLNSERCGQFPPGITVVNDSKAELKEQLDEYYGRLLGDPKADSRFSAAFRYVCACAKPGTVVDDRMKSDVLEHVKDPRSIVDIPGMIAFFGFVHRTSVFCNSQ